MSGAGAENAAGREAPPGRSLPFGRYERMLAVRYLFATRKDGGVALMSIIAFVGVMLSVAALIAIMSIMNGFRYEMLTRLLGIDGHVFVQAQSMSVDEAQAVADTLVRVDGVEIAYPAIEAPAGATGGAGEFFLALVRGIRPEDAERTPFIQQSLVGGGSPEFGAAANGGDVIYAGEGLAGQLGAGLGGAITLIGPEGAQGPFGSSLRRKAYTVGDYVNTGLSDYDRALVYMPLEQAQLFFNKEGVVDQVEVRLAEPDAVGALRRQIELAVGPRYFVTDWRDRRQSLFNALQVERGAMRLILMLVVVIAALNIISGFTMLVRNKARDIAILRTVGVHRGSVLRVFLMSGAMLGALGTLAGLALGVLFCTYIGPIQGTVEAICQCEVFAADVYGLDHLPARIDWNEVAAISGWGFIVSVLVTLIPAWFAARLDPVEALRYE